MVNQWFDQEIIVPAACCGNRGQGIHLYVMQVQLDRACELPSVPALSLADIAAEFGFADQSHLTRCFKRRFGVPPRQWRVSR
jgi:AraC family transcriptional regulator